ncbi:hypothetical protein SLS64_009553 [Diaporthe eres]|uniref:2EXR domain-containing protein n=1 Tax=Diaporthe eres TaxID=83184 RepID=A0ABR1NSG1_DIAER
MAQWKASGSHDDEMGILLGVPDNSRESSLDPIGEGDGVIFRPFKYLPAEVRIMIWTAAAVAAKPRGVYQFKFKEIKLGLASDNYPLAQSMFTHIRRLDDNGPLVREIRDMMQSVYKGDCVSTFTPLPEVGRFTREIRDLLRSCPEARSELIRAPAFASSFSFHRLQAGQCDLGVIRPFCYDTDWISLTELAHNLTIRSSTPGVLCTPDIAAIQHLAVPHFECFCPGAWRALLAQMRTLAAFPSLKSLGIYDPCFSVRRVSHWDRLITQDQRFFLKGVSTSASDGARPGRRLTGARFSDAMMHLRALVREVGWKQSLMKAQHWPRPASPRLADLKFCFLLHAGSQAGLDLMKFREDGSHLDDVARIEDLGPLGVEVKALQIMGARN